MSNNNNDIDVYADNPNEGRSSERVVDNNPQNTTTSQNERPNELMASSTREQALQASAQRGPGSVSSGQQSSTSSDSSGVGGYGQPESGFGSDAGGGYAQSDTGYNQASYNQQGTYSDAQANQSENDGLRDTLGSGYDSHQDGVTADRAQEDYNPTHSGVRHAQNNPGQNVDTPGRDVGSSWGEDEQMGSSTDTPDRRNPGA